MRIHFATILLAFLLSTCAGPQALADDFTTQQRYELRHVYADAAPITEQQLAQPTVVRPTGPITINQPNATSGLDFSPVVNSLQQVLNMALTALLGAIAAWMSTVAAKYFKMKIDASEITKDIDTGRYASFAIQKAIAYALQMLGLDASDLKNVEIRNTFLRVAADFLLKQFPDTVRWVVSGTQGASGMTVSQYIEAHLPVEAALEPKLVKTPTGLRQVPPEVAAKMEETEPGK